MLIVEIKSSQNQNVSEIGLIYEMDGSGEGR